MMKLERLPNWKERLSRFIVSTNSLHFSYGNHDCCTFTCGAVMSMTGVDPMAEFRGTYDSLISYKKMLRSRGWANLESIFNYKFPSQPLASARRGDLVGFSGCFGVSLGGRGLFLAEGDEKAFISRDKWDKSWRIG